MSTFKGEMKAIIAGISAIITIFYYMTAELIQALSLDILPQAFALFWSFFANLFFFIPALLGLLFGVLGTPFQWLNLFNEAKEIYWPPGNTIFDFLYGVFRLLVANAWQNSDRDTKEITPVQTKSRNDNESWVYINGVATTSELALANTKLIYNMFGRPVTIAYNPANGMILDLIECIVWKTGAFNFGGFESAPRDNLIKILKRELESNKTKVVLFAHSQGTIITGNAIEELYAFKKLSSLNKTYAELMLEKLEVYTFANCAHVMSKDKVRYLENIYNGRDFVAWLGQLYPFPDCWKDDKGKTIRITQSLAVGESKSWGHLLNTHYLAPMKRSKDQSTRKYRDSKLWQYFDGRFDGESSGSGSTTSSTVNSLKKIE